MRKTISGLIAAIAVLSAAPAMACGGGLFGSCSPCGQSYVSACAPPVYVAPVVNYGGCNIGCGGWAHERLADPEQQYYYVNQGPTYTGPGNWAPRRTYQEGYVSGSYGRPYYGYDGGYRARPYYGARYGAGYRYGVRPALGYGVRYGVGRGYGLGRGYGAGYGVGARYGMGYRGGYRGGRIGRY